MSMDPFGPRKENVVRALEIGSTQPCSDISVATLSILAGMGYSEQRLATVGNRLRYAESGTGIEYEEDVEWVLRKEGISSPTALHIATNAFIVTGKLPREPSDAELDLYSTENQSSDEQVTVYTAEDNFEGF